MKEIEVEAASVSTTTGSILPAMEQVASYSDDNPDGDGNIWHLDLRKNKGKGRGFLISVIEWHPTSDWYKEGGDREASAPWEYQIDVLGDNGESIHECYWIFKYGFDSKEEAEQAALLALQEEINQARREMG